MNHNQELMLKHIQDIAATGRMSLVSFTRSNVKPSVYGRFVNSPDSAELAKKGMVRFVSESNVGKFLSGDITVTRIHDVTTIALITNY